MKSLKSIIFCLTFVFIVNIAFSAKSQIGILAFDGFLTSDVTAPLEVFGAASKKKWFSNYEVIVISASKNKTIISEEGLKIIADKTIYDELKLKVLIVASAYEMTAFLKNKDLINFIKKQNHFVSWMASHCAGAFLLGESGVLDGKKATTWAGGEKDLSKAYPKIKVQIDKNVVVDKNVITSNGGPVSYQASFKLLEKLSSEKHAKEIADLIQFSRLKKAFVK